MRKATLLPVAFVVAALFVAALAGPAGAVPPSSEDTETGVTCDGLGHITVQTTPGGQISAWNTVTGEHYVVKSFSWTLSVDAKINDVPRAFTADESAFKDTGAKGKANGRTELVKCVADRSDTFDLSLYNLSPDKTLTADDADELNSYLGTDVFAEGQAISGPYSEEFVYMVLVPGKKR